jgi:hypothetical protein
MKPDDDVQYAILQAVQRQLGVSENIASYFWMRVQPATLKHVQLVDAGTTIELDRSVEVDGQCFRLGWSKAAKVFVYAEQPAADQ